MVERPIGITVLTVLFAINGISLLLMSFGLIIRFVGPTLFSMAVVMIVLGVLSLLEARGIWNLKNWARSAGIILAVLSLPVGVILSMGMLYFLLVHKETKQIFENVKNEQGAKL